jgi:hypothetical protein
MSVSVGNLFKGFIWAVVGSIIFGVLLFPLGGSGGLVGLSFLVNNAIAVYVISLILYFYPTQTTPIFKRFLGFRGVESSTIFVVAIEAAAIGLWILYWLVGVAIGFLGWWTTVVGVELAAAHFIVSAGVLTYAWHQSHKHAEPGSWYIAPILIILALLLVPLAYQGVLFQ